VEASRKWEIFGVAEREDCLAVWKLQRVLFCLERPVAWLQNVKTAQRYGNKGCHFVEEFYLCHRCRT